MKTQLLLFLLIFCFQTVSAQKSIYGRSYEDVLPDNYKINIPELRDHILNDIPDDIKKKHSRLTYRFADQQAYYISKRISSGIVYSDWVELEDYVNEVMQKVLPEELKSNEVVHAYLVREGSFNAAMNTSGHMYIHIGIFSQVTDEATLAFIIAHEVAHYYKQHSLKDYIKRETDLISKSKKSRNSIANELESDELAMQWLYDAGYNIEGIHKCLRILKRIDNKIILSLPTTWELKKTSHPSSDSRLVQINDFAKNNYKPEAPNFIVSEEKFHRLKKECKPEILKALMNDFEYSKCIEEAFKFHVFDPDNEAYVYYLMEAIRRYCYLNDERWTENFITNKYYINIEGDFDDPKPKMQSHFFERFELEILGIAPKEGSKIKARFYWKDEPKFTTYEQAFVFFTRVSEVMACKECVLTNALSFGNYNPEIRDSVLQTYINLDGVRFKDFAQGIIDDSILNSLTEKKLLVFNDFYVYVNQGQETIPIRIQSNGDNSYISGLFDEVISKFPNRIPVFLPDLKKNKINDFQLFSILKDFSMVTVLSHTKTQMHILNPEYYELFQRYGVNEIEFVTCRYGEYRKKEKTEEAYSEIAEMDYKTIFAQTKRTRFMEVGITSVREMENAKMKVRYYGGENKLKFKDEGRPGILAEIINQIYNKEIHAKERDRKYRVFGE